MIDQTARLRLLQDKSSKELDRLYADSLIQKKTNEVLLTQLLQSNKETQLYLDKLAKALLIIYKKIPASLTMPEKHQIEGDVIVSSLPSVEINNFEELTRHLQNQEQAIIELTDSLRSFQKDLPFLDIPDIDMREFNFEKPIKEDHSDIIKSLENIKQVLETTQDVAPQDNTILLTGLGRIESGLVNLKETLLSLPKPGTRETKVNIPPLDISPIVDAIHEIPHPQSNEDMLDALYRVEQGIAALVNRPQMTTPPVTHVSLNSLNGTLLTTQIQLGSIATPLPAIPLANRRSLQFFNNGLNTIYFGGSTVTTGNGIPVLSGAYSDILDFGVNVLIYGISQSGQNNDVRVLEVSDEASGR